MGPLPTTAKPVPQRPPGDGIKAFLITIFLYAALVFVSVAFGQDASAPEVPEAIKDLGGDVLAYGINEYGMPFAFFVLVWRMLGVLQVLPKMSDVRIPLAPVELTVSDHTIDKIASAIGKVLGRGAPPKRRSRDDSDEPPLSAESMATPVEAPRGRSRVGP